MSEYANDLVVETYRKLLNRSPDPDGFVYWTNAIDDQLKNGKMPDEVKKFVVDAFKGSSEYKSLNVK